MSRTPPWPPSAEVRLYLALGAVSLALAAFAILSNIPEISERPGYALDLAMAPLPLWSAFFLSLGRLRGSRGYKVVGWALLLSALSILAYRSLERLGLLP